MKASPLPLVVCVSCMAMPLAAEPLLMISIDGLHPSYVIEADRHDLEIPTLRAFVREGAYASGVVGVMPTVTFPSHTTLVTGTSPAKHGIVANTPFDPRNTNREGWYWYAEDVRVPTLWFAAKARGLTTAAVNWSVTVGDTNIDYLIPELWRAFNDEDIKLLRAVSRPEGLLAQLEHKLAEPFINGYEDTLEADAVRTRFTVALLREHRPTFAAVHLIALDGFEHRDGPWTPPVFATLEALDKMIGEISAAALANDPDTVIAIVSDHGFFATHTAVNLRVPFVAAGLIELGAVEPGVVPTIKSWQAQLIPSGGSAAVILENRGDEAVRTKVRALLGDLARDSANGIERVVERHDIESSGGFPDADFIVEFAPGFYSGAAVVGGLLTPATSKGTHGYRPDHPEMHASLFLKGRSIAAQTVGIIDMRAIAPTLAEILGVSLPGAERPPVRLVRTQRGAASP